MGQLLLMWCILTAPPPATPQTLYVLGSGVNLRANPDASAKAVVVVPIASEVKALAVDGEWTQVVYGKHRGWMKTVVLSPEKPTLENAMKQYRAAADLAGRRTWIERAVALDPESEDALREMVNVMEEAKDAAALAWARDHLQALTLDGPLLEVMQGNVLLEGPCEGPPPTLPESLKGPLVFISERDVQPATLGKPGCWSDEYSGGHRTVVLAGAGEYDEGLVVPAPMVDGLSLVHWSTSNLDAGACFSKKELKALASAATDEGKDAPQCLQATAGDWVIQLRAITSEGGDAIFTRDPQWRFTRPMTTGWEPRCGDSEPLAAARLKDGRVRIFWKGHWILAGDRPEFFSTTAMSGPQRGTTTTAAPWLGLQRVTCK